MELINIIIFNLYLSETINSTVLLKVSTNICLVISIIFKFLLTKIKLAYYFFIKTPKSCIKYVVIKFN